LRRDRTLNDISDHTGAAEFKFCGPFRVSLRRHYMRSAGNEPSTDHEAKVNTPRSGACPFRPRERRLSVVCLFGYLFPRCVQKVAGDFEIAVTRHAGNLPRG
jgi:hypothetical protein